jgi:hypothetical protein
MISKHIAVQKGVERKAKKFMEKQGNLRLVIKIEGIFWFLLLESTAYL